MAVTNGVVIRDNKQRAGVWLGGTHTGRYTRTRLAHELNNPIGPNDYPTR